MLTRSDVVQAEKAAEDHQVNLHAGQMRVLLSYRSLQLYHYRSQESHDCWSPRPQAGLRIPKKSSEYPNLEQSLTNHNHSMSKNNGLSLNNQQYPDYREPIPGMAGDRKNPHSRYPRYT